MVISHCIPCHNRTYDLKKIMPFLVDAINNSPPIEIVILDYNSKDDLAEYVNSLNLQLKNGNNIKYTKYTGRDYYHMAHARNLSVLSAKGEYVVCACTDIILNKNFFTEIRKIINNAEWMISAKENTIGLLIVKRKTFIDIGGYDERFEFYSPEDKDIVERLKRTKSKNANFDDNLLKTIRTNNKDKVKNYRLKISKWDMKKLMHPIFKENNENNVIVVNKRGWGKW